MDIYRHIDRNKIQFDFLTSIEHGFQHITDEIEEMGGCVYHIPHILKSGPLRYRRALALFFKAHPEYLIIHAHMDKMNGIVLDEAKKIGVPIRIAHSHSAGSEGGWFKRKVKHHYGKYLKYAATDRMACSADAGRWLFPDATDRVTILRNGIVFDDFCFSEEVRDRKRADLGLVGAKVLLHVGRFDKVKNQSFIVDIFKKLNDEEGSYHLLFAGKGELLDTIKAYTKDIGVDDKVEFLGLRSDVPELMMVADTFLLPSIHEGLSVTLIEAQASGLPCIITDTLADESIIRPDLVERLPLGDAGAWAAKVRDSISISATRPRTSVLAPEYDIANIAVELERFYLQRISEIKSMHGSGTDETI
jgi:glycosyltransferase involved in cell wall biosynthesis